MVTVAGWALRSEPPKRPTLLKKPPPPRALAVCVDEVSEWILGEGEGAFDVAGVA